MARPIKKTPAKPAAKTARAASKTTAKKSAVVKAAPKPKPVKAAVEPAPAGGKKAPAKKAVAAKATVPEKPKPQPKARKVSLSEKDLTAIREELLEHRATLEKELEDLDLGSLNIAQSELSGEVSFDEEYADAGTFTFERERDLSLSNNIRDLMEKIDMAMRKIADGSYGTCERCGNPIDKARLKALPYSVLCITCKQQEERIR